MRRFILVLLSVTLIAGCDRASGPSHHIDAEWHRKALVQGALAPWLAVAPQPDGFMRTGFERDWQPRPSPTPMRQDLTNQSRLVYSMAVGYQVTQDRRYLDAARAGADFLLAHFHDEVQGGFFTIVAADGVVIADRKRSYGQACALLALATLAKVSGEARYKAAALRTWEEVASGLLEPGGGLVNSATRSFKSEDPLHTQNPVMHMFEGLLALVDATGDAKARQAARALGDFVINKLMQGLPDGSARIPEWYDADWHPLPTRDKGGYIDLGHQFEWVHLLYQAEGLGISPVYGAVAERILAYALKEGYDENDGGAFDRIYPDGETERRKGYWQQAECLNGLIAAASANPRPELWRRMDQTLAFVQDQFIDKKHGGWHPRACPRGGCVEDQPEPYHMAALHLAALSAVGALAPVGAASVSAPPRAP